MNSPEEKLKLLASTLEEWIAAGNISMHSYGYSCRDYALQLKRLIFGDGKMETFKRAPIEAIAGIAYADGMGRAVTACPHGVLLGWCIHCGDVNKDINAVMYSVGVGGGGGK